MDENKKVEEQAVGRVKAINISKVKGVVKDTIFEGLFQEDHGLVGDAHAGKWHRQVSLLAQESVDKMTALGVEGLCTGKFAENITTEALFYMNYQWEPNYALVKPSKRFHK